VVRRIEVLLREPLRGHFPNNTSAEDDKADKLS
jgi:hypothetical protein